MYHIKYFGLGYHPRASGVIWKYILCCQHLNFLVQVQYLLAYFQGSLLASSKSTDLSVATRITMCTAPVHIWIYLVPSARRRVSCPRGETVYVLNRTPIRQLACVLSGYFRWEFCQWHNAQKLTELCHSGTSARGWKGPCKCDAWDLLCRGNDGTCATVCTTFKIAPVNEEADAISVPPIFGPFAPTPLNCGKATA